MNARWHTRLTHALQQQHEQRRWRTRTAFEYQRGTHIQYQQRHYLNFSSNDYLGLAASYAQHLAPSRQIRPSSGLSSPLICGHSQAHQRLEEQLAQHTGYPRALLFSSGYSANLAILGTLAQRHDRILHDQLNHASLLDGSVLSRAQTRRYRHLDLNHLTERLATPHAGHTLVVSDSLFSMDGDLAPVSAMATLCDQHNALLIIDDAHGFGVLGERGEGVRAQAHLSAHQLPVYMGTLSKALGGMGAFVAGSDELIEYLIQFARPYGYSTSLPSAWVYATQCVLQRVAQGDLQRHLQANIRYFSKQIQNTNLPVIGSDSAIQPLLVGSNQCAMAMSVWLRKHGIWLTAIRPPTVAEGQARLRITLTAAHQHDDIDALINALQQAWSVCGTNR